METFWIAIGAFGLASSAALGLWEWTHKVKKQPLNKFRKSSKELASSVKTKLVLTQVSKILEATERISELPFTTENSAKLDLYLQTIAQACAVICEEDSKL
jgi:hypothetical protein